MYLIESGNVAAAIGVKLARAQVIAAYPITPQTPLTEKLSELVESGKLDAEYVLVESEHSAMAVCIAAATAGEKRIRFSSIFIVTAICRQRPPLSPWRRLSRRDTSWPTVTSLYLPLVED